jgi:hypothetical protein
MLRQILFKVMVLTALPAATVGTALAQSNIDPANKFAWGENIGWTNWRDAGGAAQGVNDAQIKVVSSCVTDPGYRLPAAAGRLRNPGLEGEHAFSVRKGSGQVHE